MKAELVLVKCQRYGCTLVCEVAAYTPTKGFVGSVLIGPLLVTIQQLNVRAPSALCLHAGCFSVLYNTLH